MNRRQKTAAYAKRKKLPLPKREKPECKLNVSSDFEENKQRRNESKNKESCSANLCVLCKLCFHCSAFVLAEETVGGAGDGTGKSLLLAFLERTRTMIITEIIMITIDRIY